VEGVSNLKPHHPGKHAYNPTVVGLVFHSINERSIPLLFSESSCMQLLSVHIPGTKEIKSGNSFLHIRDYDPKELPLTKVTHARWIIQRQISSAGNDCCWHCA
jgi:hypothetical protein